MVDGQFSSKIQDLQSRVAELQERVEGADLSEALRGLGTGMQEVLVAGEELLRGAEQERRHAQELAELLGRESDILRAIMENTDAHLAYLDTQFNFVRVNSTYACGSGHSQEELIGHNHFDLFPNPENQSIFEQVRDTGQPVEFHAKPFEFADQPERGITYWDWTLVPVKDAAGEIQGLVLSLVNVSDRERAERTLQRERDFISAVLDTAGALVVVLDPQGRIVRFNRACEQMTGYTHDEVVGKPFWDLFLIPEEVEPVKAVFEGLRAGQFPSEYENYWVTRGGIHRLIAWSNTALVDARGRVEFVIGTGIDITDPARAEAELRESEQKYRQLIETAQEGVWAIDAESKTTFVNPRMAEMLGYSVEEMQGQHLFSFMDERAVEVCQRNLERRRQGIKERHDFEFLRKDGTRVYTSMETSPITDERGDYVGALALVADITERVRAEARLGEQNQFITTVFESLGHPFYVVDAADYSVKMANSAALEGDFSPSVTCYALTHQRTEPCVGVGHRCPMEEIKQTGKPVLVEHVHYDQAGQRRFFEVHAHPIFDDEDQVAQIIEYTLDVTDRKATEEALRAARDELEVRVQERTDALAIANQALRAEIAERQQAEETLRDSEERYRRLVELAFEAIVIHSQGKLLYANPQAVKLVGGTSPEALIGKPTRDFVHPDYLEMVQKREQQLGEEGTGVPLVEEKLLRLDGTSVDVEVASVPITYRGQPAVQTVIRDVSARKQAEMERERERMRIARDLHDTLGHSLGYLHLNLDDLAESDALAEHDQVRKRLARLRDVANQGYELVRGMLAASLPSNASDLASALLVQARSVGQRGNFEVQLTSQGQPRFLSPIVQQQLLYLFQEALNNVEKHAGARRVTIDLAWGTDSLTISLSDDGQGFDPAGIQSGSCFGLAIMQERAREINGQLSISSCPDMGTRLVLRLPLNRPVQSSVPELTQEGGR